MWVVWVIALLLVLLVRIRWSPPEQASLQSNISTRNNGPVGVAKPQPPTPTPIVHHSAFQAGMVFPQWGNSAYSDQDADWQTGLHEIGTQTAARWVAMTLTFSQASEFATQVKVSSATPAPEAMAAGIVSARQLGYHIAVMPMITLTSVHTWAGYIAFPSQVSAQSWFDSYWQTLQPYVVAAQQAGAEQFSIGTEYDRLEANFPALWQQLLQRVSAVFSGRVVYSVNWSSLARAIPGWMHDSRLSALGISVYIPLTTTPQHLNPQILPALWHTKVLAQLDDFARRVGKPVFISELGYLDSAYAGYNPWESQMNGPRDDEQQAALFDAALQNIYADPAISGVFIWAWSVAPYAPNYKAAAKTLYNWYSSPLR